MKAVNVLEARNNLSRLVSVAEHGGEVVIARRGRPVARIVPVAPSGEHTAASFAEWSMAHRMPRRTARPIGAVDVQIAEEREAWEDVE